MKLQLWCEVEAGTDKGGEDVQLWAELSLLGDGSDAELDAALVDLEATVNREYDRLAQQTAREHAGDPVGSDDEVFDEWPGPDDDGLESPDGDEGTVYVTPERVFTGVSGHYEFQLVVPRAEVVAAVLNRARVPKNWTVHRKYGTTRFTWASGAVLVDVDGNAD